jgi:hypothetical protein
MGCLSEQPVVFLKSRSELKVTPQTSQDFDRANFVFRQPPSWFLPRFREFRNQVLHECLLRISLRGTSTLNDAHKDSNDREHEQNVDESPHGVGTDHSEQPQD